MKYSSRSEPRLTLAAFLSAYRRKQQNEENIYNEILENLRDMCYNLKQMMMEVVYYGY